MFGPFTAIGAQTTFFSIVIQPNSLTEVNLEEHEVPKDAKILNVNYTAQNGNLIPLEVHGNNPKNRGPAQIIKLWPMPKDILKSVDTEIAIAITWVPHTANDDAWQSLVDAFEYYAAGRYASVIVPANVAVEAPLLRMLRRTLAMNKISRDRIKSFFSQVTYSHQLNVLLPVLLAPTPAPKMPAQLQGQLNRLRDLRNELAHRGATKVPVTKDEAATFLCAALFGFHYITVVQDFIS